jgi:hypothetical protein
MELGDQLLVMRWMLCPMRSSASLRSLERILDLVRAKPEDLFGLQVDNSDTVDLGRIRNETVALCVVENS